MTEGFSYPLVQSHSFQWMSLVGTTPWDFHLCIFSFLYPFLFLITLFLVFFQNLAAGERVLYSLYGIVEHSGSMRGGHYTAYVKVRTPQRKTEQHHKNLPGQRVSHWSSFQTFYSYCYCASLSCQGEQPEFWSTGTTVVTLKMSSTNRRNSLLSATQAECPGLMVQSSAERNLTDLSL